MGQQQALGQGAFSNNISLFFVVGFLK